MASLVLASKNSTLLTVRSLSERVAACVAQPAPAPALLSSSSSSKKLNPHEEDEEDDDEEDDFPCVACFVRAASSSSLAQMILTASEASWNSRTSSAVTPPRTNTMTSGLRAGLGFPSPPSAPPPPPPDDKEENGDDKEEEEEEDEDIGFEDMDAPINPVIRFAMEEPTPAAAAAALPPTPPEARLFSGCETCSKEGMCRGTMGALRPSSALDNE